MPETPQETVYRVFRENKRYTGDGLPNEPVGAPLPVGDPASGVHNPKKVDMRQALLAPLGTMDAEVQLARDWASEDEDVVVADGEYSAKHYSAKAADSATEAANQVSGVVPSLQRIAVGAAVQSVDLGNEELHPNSVRVFIDGVYQFSDTWSLTDGVITPVGGSWPGDGTVENMEVVIDATSAAVFNVPSNGSVTREKLADQAVGEDEIAAELLEELRQDGFAAYATDTPFGQAGMRVLLGLENDAHYGFNSGILDAGDGRWVIVYRKASNHTVVNGSEIRAIDTYDRGATLVNDRLIYSTPSADTRNFVARVMADGRFGIICSRREAAPSLAYIDPVFIYSDDQGETWSSQVITANSSGQGINFHGNLIDYPETVGGHDSQGFIGYSYASAGPGDVDALVTVDNGATWSWVMNVALSTPTMTEISCSRIGLQDKWIMIGRPAGSIGDHGIAWVSTDPLNFGEGVDSGVEMAGNPPLTIYDDATNLFWYIGFARRDRGWQRDTDVGIENVMLVASADADALFAAEGDMSALGVDWSIAAYLPDWASGYLHPFKIGGKWYGTFVCGEDYLDHSYSKLCLIGDFLPTGADRANFSWMFQWSAVGYLANYRTGVAAGFGTTPPTEQGYFTTNVASSKAGLVSETFTDSSRSHQKFRNTNGVVGSISTSGSTTSFNTSSDGQLKIDRVPIEDEVDIDAVWAAIEPLAYTMLSGKDLSAIDGRWFGLIAQDLYEVWPQAVTPGQGKPGEHGYVPWAVDYSKVAPLMIARQKHFERQTNERLAALEGEY